MLHKPLVVCVVDRVLNGAVPEYEEPVLLVRLVAKPDKDPNRSRIGKRGLAPHVLSQVARVVFNLKEAIGVGLPCFGAIVGLDLDRNGGPTVVSSDYVEVWHISGKRRCYQSATAKLCTNKEFAYLPDQLVASPGCHSSHLLH